MEYVVYLSFCPLSPFIRYPLRCAVCSTEPEGKDFRPDCIKLGELKLQLSKHFPPGEYGIISTENMFKLDTPNENPTTNPQFVGQSQYSCILWPTEAKEGDKDVQIWCHIRGGWHYLVENILTFEPSPKGKPLQSDKVQLVEILPNKECQSKLRYDLVSSGLALTDGTQQIVLPWLPNTSMTNMAIRGLCGLLSTFRLLLFSFLHFFDPLPAFLHRRRTCIGSIHKIIF